MTINRRQFAQGALALGAVAGGASAGLAQEPPVPAWQQAVDKILGGAKPGTGKVNMELPEIAENGNTVPFTLSVDSPMTEQDYVKAIHIISTGNPQPGVATFRFTPASGKAAVSGRMRLGRTQDIITVAEFSNGQFLTSKRNVKVTIGGCGG